jgi:hypothetical protein
VFAELAVVTLIIWVVALNRPPDVTEAAACNPPADNTSSEPGQSKLGEQVTRASMTEVNPANLADTKIRVLNASGQGGQAAEVAGQLRDLGFSEPTGWRARVRSGSAPVAAPRQLPSGSSPRASSCSRTSGPITPWTWRSAPTSPSWREATMSKPCCPACDRRPPHPPTRR